MPDRIVRALTDRRLALGMSQADLAFLLRTRAGTLGMWETGQTSPRLDQVEEWARLLGVALTTSVGADLIAEAA